MLDLRGRDTVRVTKVKGHADEVMVFDGRVRELDRLGNNAADYEADFGRRRVGPAVIDARRNLSGVCGPASWPFWTRRTVMRFFRAFARSRLVLALPRWAQKLIFHITTVKRNRNETEAQKNQILSTQQRKNKMKEHERP